MKIAVDLDDTLSTVDRVTRASGYIERKGLPFKLKDPDAHALTEVFDWKLDDVLEFVREGGVTIFTDAEVKRGARETLEALRAAGHEIVVLTARTKEWFTGPERVTRDWLEKRRVPYDEIVTDVDFPDKGKYCAEHGIAVLIDDHVECCLAAQQLGVKAILMVGKNNVARAHEINYGGSNWRQIAAILASVLNTI